MSLTSVSLKAAVVAERRGQRFCRWSASTSAITTFAPSATSVFAVALPMPPAPPVTIATFPASSCDSIRAPNWGNAEVADWRQSHSSMAAGNSTWFSLWMCTCVSCSSAASRS